MSNFIINNELLKKEWDYKKNRMIDINQITQFSNKKAWWICSECGYEWNTTISSRTSGTGCPKCSRKKISNSRRLPKKGESLLEKNPELAKEWHPTKNRDLTPDKVKTSTSDKVWWKCRVGHEWQATINHRNNGRNCPKCSKELSTSFPEQTIYFYLKKIYNNAINRYKLDNKEIDIYLPSIKIGIEYDGIYYHPKVNKEKEKRKDEFFYKNGIRIIRIKETKENIKKHVVYKNTILYNPDKKYQNLKNVILYLISFIDSNYNIEINIDRDKPKIYNELFTNIKKNSVATNPILLKEWDYDNNQNLNPEYISLGSNFKFWWKCNIGHKWQAIVSSRNLGNGCPYCSNQKVLKGYNDVATTNPGLLKEWNYEKNIKITPYDITGKSHVKVWWKCKKGHEWQSKIKDRNNGNGCPDCYKKSIEKY